MRFKPGAFLFAVMTALALAGCANTPIEPDAVWREAEVVSPSDNVVWKIALLSAEHQGFPIAGGLAPSSGIIVTGWQTSLQPFSGKGTRKRAEIEIEPTGPRRWLVRTRVQMQRNMSLVAPLDASRAEWEWVPEDVLGADILLRRIVGLLGPEFEVESEREKSSVRP